MIFDDAYNLIGHTDSEVSQNKIWSTKQYFVVPNFSAGRADGNTQQLLGNVEHNRNSKHYIALERAQGGRTTESEQQRKQLKASSLLKRLPGGGVETNRIGDG